MHTADPSDQYRDLAPARVSRRAAAGRILSPSEERLLELEAEAGIAKPARNKPSARFWCFLVGVWLATAVIAFAAGGFACARATTAVPAPTPREDDSDHNKFEPPATLSPPPSPAPLASSPPPPNRLATPATRHHHHHGSSLLDGCKHVYLDVGSNIGLQLRKVYEPDKFPGAAILPIFDKFFGKDVIKRRAEVCAVAMEPNTDHASRLEQLASTYTKLGWRTFFLPVAASTVEGNTTFYRDVSFVGARNNQWSASTLALAANGQQQPRRAMTVRTIDLAEWIRSNVLHRKSAGGAGGGGSVVMKLDIEGGEFVVLPHLLASRVLCQGVAYMYAEFHSTYTSAPNFDPKLEQIAVNATKGCGVELTSLDDEIPLEPSAPYCKRLAARAKEVTAPKALAQIRESLRFCYAVPPLPS